MITKSDMLFLFQLYDKNGEITAKKQDVYIVNSKFYQKMKNLKELKLIVTHSINEKMTNKYINVYEITLRGIVLVKILRGLDYE